MMTKEEDWLRHKEQTVLGLKDPFEGQYANIGMQLPDMDGAELARNLGRKTNNFEVLLRKDLNLKSKEYCPGLNSKTNVYTQRLLQDNSEQQRQIKSKLDELYAKKSIVNTKLKDYQGKILSQSS
jgi:hypothetical protein